MANSGFDFPAMSESSHLPPKKPQPDAVAAEQEHAGRRFKRNEKPAEPHAGEPASGPPAQASGTEEPVERIGPDENTPRPKRFTKSRPPGTEALLTELPEAPELESAWGNETVDKRPLPWGWFALLGLLIAGGIGWSIVHVIKADPQLEAIRDEAESTLVREERSVLEARELIEGIQQAIHAFCAASDIEELLRVSRHPERVRPLMEDHYQRHPLEPLGLVEIQALRPLTLGRLGGFWMASAGLEDGNTANFIIQAEEGREARVDWETAVCYQPMAWDDFAETKPQGVLPDFRVYVEPDTLFSHEFADSDQWDCYRLTALHSEASLYGYVRSDSPTAEMMRAWFGQYPGKPASMILCLGFPEGLASPNGVVIDHAKSVRWIYVAPPIAE